MISNQRTGGRAEETPIDEGIVNKGFEHRHHAALVLPNHAHDIVARQLEVALNAAHLRRREEKMDKREGERGEGRRRWMRGKMRGREGGERKQGQDG